MSDAERRMMDMTIDALAIRHLTDADRTEWLRLRRALWPECSVPEHELEMREVLQRPSAVAVFVAEETPGRLAGFAQVSLHDWAVGCVTRPVGYIEGWYVDVEFRRRGLGRQLMAAAEQWARQQGCAEMASDCIVENHVSQASHTALGYVEVNRTVQFRKEL